MKLCTNVMTAARDRVARHPGLHLLVFEGVKFGGVRDLWLEIHEFRAERDRPEEGIPIVPRVVGDRAAAERAWRRLCEGPTMEIEVWCRLFTPEIARGRVFDSRRQRDVVILWHPDLRGVHEGDAYDVLVNDMGEELPLVALAGRKVSEASVDVPTPSWEHQPRMAVVANPNGKKSAGGHSKKKGGAAPRKRKLVATPFTNKPS